MKTLKAALILLLAGPLFGAYQYYYSDTLTSINSNNWWQNGDVTATAAGLTSTVSGGGSLISKLGVPGGSNDYEVRSTVTLTESSGEFFHYLRATSDARRSPSTAGSFYTVGLENLTLDPNHLITTANLKIYRRVGGVLTMLASVPVGCPSGTVMRSIIRGSRLDVWVNGVWYLSVTDTSLPTGSPGIGVRYTSVNTISRVDLGALDTVAPSPVSAQSIATYPLSNTIDMQWQGASDGANGIGVAHYLIYRNSVFLRETTTAEFTDETVSPSTTYTYGIVARDFHLNDSTQTSFTVTTAPAGAINPQRVGVRPLGTYWGAMGEQIDTLSGNLNFTLPLVTAMGRNGWSAGFALSYNSQLWRKDGDVTWKLGRDVGYGFGWRLQAGSLTPYWEDPWTIHHYTYVDSTGAEYRLDVSAENGEKWSSRDGIYLTYDRISNRLYFPDGSFWFMGCQAAGTEQDAGTRYPTVMQDTNGNQVFIRYLTGLNAPWGGSSARISEIEDVRAASQWNGSFTTYAFTFNTDAIPHITGIQSSVGDGVNYSFSYAAGQTLNSPFTPPVSFGTTSILTSVTRTGIGLTHQFDYSTNGSGELTKVTFPYGGFMLWNYYDFTYSGSRTIREIHDRYLCKIPGGPWTATFLWSWTASNPLGTLHVLTTMYDVGGSVGQKLWIYSDSPASNIGQLLSYDEQPLWAAEPTRRQEYIWTQDANGNPYVASVLTTLDKGTAYQKQSKTEQTLDVYGNVTQTKIYGYASLTTPVRTFNNTYLSSSSYAARNIRNRLLTSTVSDGTQQTQLVSYTYDGNVWERTFTNLRNHDSANYGTGFLFRGNPGVRVAGGVTTSYTCDKTGTVISSYDPQGHSVSVDPAAGMNYAVPGVITPINESGLAQSMTWTPYLRPATVTLPNGAVSSIIYDSYSRPSQSTSVHGAITNYTYTNSPPTSKASINGRWTKATMDGLGRTIKVETGNGSTTVSIVETEYDSCACSPLGKVKRVSQPYAPGATVYWTTYTYDCLGRTLSVAQPNSSGSTTYVYQGNTVTVTDPAGKWKKYTTDALGNLVQVTEPDPSLGNVETYYSYNVRNQLIGVSMPRGGTTQTRTFNYSLSTGRLSSATNPENGTVSYTYNADGTLATKIDAKNQQVQYSYDTFQRVTQIRRYPSGEDPCQRADFYYDTNPYDGGYTENGWGRMTAARWGGASCQGGEWAYLYNYTPGGLATGKQLRRLPYGPSLNVSYWYDNEGRKTSMGYPTLYDDGEPVQAGAGVDYTYDVMGRPYKLLAWDSNPPTEWVSSASYNAAGQMTGMTGSMGSETRSYNALGQLTRQTSYPMDYEYRYSATQNDGRITQRKDWVSGEEVNYQYDNLKRLIAASTTGPEWGQSFGYDGFGNLLNQTVTKGSAPSLYVNVNPDNNRMWGGSYSYDDNGNLTSTPERTMGYNVENRLTELSGSPIYVYDAFGQRVWETSDGPGGRIRLYGADGALLGIYDLNLQEGRFYSEGTWAVNVYFAGRLVWEVIQPVHQDRLGSAVKLFPYGEEGTTTYQDRVKFATYRRDSRTGLDYAQNRDYSRTIGRFTTPDPYQASGGPANPQSWNRYSYVQNDPVNYYDPLGLMVACPPGTMASPDGMSCLSFNPSAGSLSPAGLSFGLSYADQLKWEADHPVWPTYTPSPPVSYSGATYPVPATDKGLSEPQPLVVGPLRQPTTSLLDTKAQDAPIYGLSGQGSQVLQQTGSILNSVSVGATLGVNFQGGYSPLNPQNGLRLGWDSKSGLKVSDTVGLGLTLSPPNNPFVGVSLPLTPGAPSLVFTVPVMQVPPVSLVYQPCGLVGVIVGGTSMGVPVGLGGYLNMGCH